MDQDDPLLRPRAASEYTQISTDQLAQLRFRGRGPTYLKPTPRTVLYRKSALDAWLAASERSNTGQVA